MGLWSDSKIVRVLSILKLTYRRLRLLKVNRNLLVYLIFLVLSIGFWCLQTLKEDSTQSVNFKLEITGVPKNIIFTSDVPSKIKANIKGRGFDFLEQHSSSEEQILRISFDNMLRKDGKATLDANTVKRLIQKQTGNSLAVQSCTPSSLELFYCTGKKKRVPVAFGGKARVGLQHVLCNIILQPDSVDVFAPNKLYDSIDVAYTERTFYKDVEDTLTRKLSLQHIRGVKMVPDSVKVTICVDLFTEKTIAVPIYCENIPQNKVLRTFPIKANVSFHVSATMYNSISEKDFLVVVDYNSIKKDDEKCQLILRGQPFGVSHVQLSPEYVEYVIEQAD